MATTYKIGEAATLLNLKTYVLRFWETEFPQIVPLRTEKGQRLYTEENLALLERIRFLLHERGLTIEGARKILHEDKEKGAVYAFTAGSQTGFATAGAEHAEADLPRTQAPEVALADTDGNSPSGIPADADDAWNADENAVKKLLLQYNLPGIKKTYPIHESSFLERPRYRHKETPLSAPRRDLLEGSPDGNVKDEAVPSYLPDAVQAVSPSDLQGGVSQSLLHALTTELEAILQLLRNGETESIK